MLKKLFANNWLPYMAADTGLLGGDDGTEDDDLTDFDDDDDLKALLSDDGTEDDDLKEDDDQDTETPETEPEPEPKPEEKMIPQSEVDRIIGERLARERKIHEDRIAHEVEAQKQKETVDQYFAGRYQEELKKWTDLGYEQEVAAKIAQQDVNKEYRIWQTEQELERLQQQQILNDKTSGYYAERSKAMASDPMVAKYIKEIDEFSQNGEVLDFDTAADFIVGKMARKGDLLSKIKTTTEQKTLANVNRRSKKSVEKGSSAASPAANSLTRDELLMAKRLGISPKEYAKNK